MEKGRYAILPGLKSVGLLSLLICTVLLVTHDCIIKHVLLTLLGFQTLSLLERKAYASPGAGSFNRLKKVKGKIKNIWIT